MTLRDNIRDTNRVEDSSAVVTQMDARMNTRRRARQKVK
jgi:hypothetical protein